jgi:hypothetical protein
MRQLSDNQATVESFLAVLGPGNWGGPSNRSPLSGKDEEDASLITRYLSAFRSYFSLSSSLTNSLSPQMTS